MAATGNPPRADIAQGFILYPKFELPQPVPYGYVPAPPAPLQAWERKKLELDMAAASVQDSNNMDSSNSQNASTTNNSNTDTEAMQRRSPTSPKKLQKHGSMLTAGSGGGPPPTASSAGASNSSSAGRGPGGGLRRSSSSFFNSLRQASSSRNKAITGGASTGSNSNNYNKSTTSHSRNSSLGGNGRISSSAAGGTQIHYDEDGGIGNSPRKTKRASNPFFAYIKRHFSINNHPDYAPNGNSGNMAAVQQNSAAGATRSTAKQSSQPPKKTRSVGFAQKMKDASGKATVKLQSTIRRLSSKSRPDELPSTWEEWRQAYTRGQIDINDIPPPPSVPANGAFGMNESSPYEAQYLPAPMPDDQRRRQLAFNRIDIEGKRGQKPSEIVVPEGEERLPDTLDGHPAFRDIVSKARETFDTAIAIITVFNENRQLFLAETGLGGMKEVPREVSFCSHAVLQKPPEPFVLNDTHNDWRFANSPLVTAHGCRAYYGVPLLAPDFSGSSDDPVPIGTLCVIDNKPRPAFTAEQRQKMSDLALLAQKTIANWSRARLRARLDAMERSFQLWKTEAETLSAGPASMALYQDVHGQRNSKRLIEGKAAGGPAGLENGDADDQVLYISKDRTASQQQSQEQQQAQGQQRSPETNAGMNGSQSNGHANDAAPGSGTVVSDETFHTAPRPQTNKQKIYDISTRLVGDSLELSLVYILRLDILAADSTEPSSVQSLSLVSSHGLPSPEPAFDAVLHLKALRSEEGGLLYQNPNAGEMKSGERMPQTEEVEYASALLVPVCESDRSGYVLAGFTDDPERVFERSDLEYMTTIASELAVYLLE